MSSDRSNGGAGRVNRPGLGSFPRPGCGPDQATVTRASSSPDGHLLLACRTRPHPRRPSLTPAIAPDVSRATARPPPTGSQCPLLSAERLCRPPRWPRWPCAATRAGADGGTSWRSPARPGCCTAAPVDESVPMSRCARSSSRTCAARSRCSGSPSQGSPLGWLLCRQSHSRTALRRSTGEAAGRGVGSVIGANPFPRRSVAPVSDCSDKLRRV
jgi:hypothetical protein